MRREDREQDILSYLSGEMPPDEQKRFECRVAGDQNLREELEQWRAAYGLARDWADEPVPGIERAEQLAVPQLAPTQKPAARIVDVRPRRVLWQVFAAAALFAAGFVLGNMSGFGTHTGATTPALKNSDAAQVQPLAPVQPPASSVEPTRTPLPEDADQGVAVEKEQPSQPPSPLYMKQENGRVLVETTLKQSGARAMWVVDGRFQLAQTTKKIR